MAHDRSDNGHHGLELENGYQSLEEMMRIFYFDAVSGQCLGSFGLGTDLPPDARPAPVNDPGRVAMIGASGAIATERGKLMP